MTSTFRQVFTSGAAAAFLSVVSAAPVWSDTLADALVGAYKHSGLIEQNRAVLRAADEDVAQAVSALRPVVSWAGNIQRDFARQRSFNVFANNFVTGGGATNTTSMSIIAELTIYAGGANRLNIEAAKEIVLATRAGLVGVEQQVLLRGVYAFMEVRRALETVSLRQNNVRVIRQELRAAQDRFEVGEVTRTDVALAEARLAESQSGLAAARGQLVIAEEEYRAAVGRRPGTLREPRNNPRIPGSIDQAKAVAVRNHPDMISVQHQVAANEIAISIAEASMKPTVSIEGRYGLTEDFDDSSFTHGGSIGIVAGGAIYQGGRLRSIVRQAQANRDAARGGLHEVRLAVQQNVGNAFVQLAVAQANRKSFQAQVEAATVAFEGVREEAKLGARTTLDVLDAEQELIDARTNLISAEVDETIASYAILATQGQLTAQSLQLNVPRYDPSEYYNLVKGAPSATSKQGKELDRVLRAIGKE